MELNITILKGVTIGDCAIISTGSVVTKDIPERTLVDWVPVKIIKKVEWRYLNEYIKYYCI